MIRIVEAFGWAVVHAVWIGLLLQVCWWSILRTARTAEMRYRMGAALLWGLGLTFFGVALLFLLAKTGALIPTRVPVSVATSPLGSGIPAALERAVEPVAWPPVLRGVGALWLTGVALFVGRLIGGWQVVQWRYTRFARPARPEWQAAVGRLGARLQLSVPRVLESASIESPALLGFVRPTVMLPTRGMQALDRAEFTAVVAHELFHLRRRDSFHSLLQGLAEALFFFHPLVWQVNASLRVEREKLCDAAASAIAPDAITYVTGLLKLEQLRDSGVHALAARGGGAFSERIRYLLDARASDRRARLAMLAGALMVAIVTGSAILLPPSLVAAARSAGPDIVTIQARDPAGEFSLTFRYGRIASASFGAGAGQPARFTQQGDSVIFFDPYGLRQFAVHVRPAGGIAWTPRSTPSP